MKREIALRIELSYDEAVELQLLLETRLQVAGADAAPEFVSMAERVSSQLRRKLGLEPYFTEKQGETI